MEKIKDIVAQMPEESERIDELLDEMLPKNHESETAKIQEKPTAKYAKNDLEEFASNYQQMPEFERKATTIFPKSVEGKEASKTMTESRARSINDTLNKGLNIGLKPISQIKVMISPYNGLYETILSPFKFLKTLSISLFVFNPFQVSYLPPLIIFSNLVPKFIFVWFLTSVAK